jgi:hypothetical protein
MVDQNQMKKFHQIILMTSNLSSLPQKVNRSDNPCPFPESLAAYADHDPDLQAAYAYFEQVFAGLKSRAGPWASDQFFAAINRLCAFIGEFNAVGRALFCGIALCENLMLIVGDALPALMGFQDKRPIIRRLTERGWLSTTPAEIGHLLICDRFRDLLTAAHHFEQTVHYLVNPTAADPGAAINPPPPPPQIDEVAAEVLARTEVSDADFERDDMMMVYLIDATADDPEDDPEDQADDPEDQADDPEDQADDPENQNHSGDIADDFGQSVLPVSNPLEDAHAELAESHAKLIEAHAKLAESHAKLIEAHAKLTEAHDRLRTKYSEKSKAFNNQKLTLARTCRALNDQNQALKVLKDELDAALASHPPAPCQESDPTCTGPIRNRFIEELRCHATENPHARRYSSEMYDFAYGLHAISPKAYRFAREALPLPSISAVVAHGQWETGYVGNALKAQSEASLSKLLQEYRTGEGLAPDEWVPATLAFDATPVNSKGIGSNWSAGSCFTFILLPLDHRHKDLVIHSERHKDGHIDDDIRTARDKLLRVAKANHFLCHFVATDGDNGVEGAHTEAFKKYEKAPPDLHSIVAMLTDGGTKDLEDWPISDLFHLLKNARAREALGKLAVSAKTPDLVTAKTLAKNVPKADKHLFEPGRHIDLLKDDLAVQTFSLDNLLWIWSGYDPHHLPECEARYWDAGDPNGGFFMAPFVALSLAVRNEALGIAARLDLLQVAFSFFFGMMQQYPKCGAQKGITENKTKESPRQTLWARAMCRRACNLCVGLYWAIRKYCAPEYLNAGFQLALNRIGTHPVECHFGMTRSTLNGDPRWERFFAAQVKAVIIHRVMRRLGFRSYIRRFSEPAGCVVPHNSEESVFINVDPTFGHISHHVTELFALLSDNGHRCGFRVGYGILKLFSELRKDLLKVNGLSSIRQSGPTAGGSIETRWYAQSRIRMEAPTLKDLDALRAAEILADE